METGLGQSQFHGLDIRSVPGCLKILLRENSLNDKVDLRRGYRATASTRNALFAGVAQTRRIHTIWEYP